jgi:DNA-binding NtrC family response regulator
MRRVFLWEEDEQERDILVALLEDEYRVIAVRGEEAVFAALRDGSWDLILVGAIGSVLEKDLTALKHLRFLAPATPIICRLPHGDPGISTALLRHGVSACISRTCSREELKTWIREVRFHSEADPSALPGAPPKGGVSLSHLLMGESEPMRQVRSKIELYARHDFPVFITGECGTGKELAAKSLHRFSRRARAPFVAVNCGAIPETILESELFGTERGAYTGAVSRPGNFEAAAGGTLFLDEITEMSGSAQAKLLRALEDGEVRRLGSRQTLHFDVRVLSATNANLDARAGAGFRYDLLERLETLILEMPPLRDRREDIPLLSRYFLDMEAMNALLGQDALDKLHGYDWPGNVRELKNTVLRAAVVASGAGSPLSSTIRADHIRFGRRPARIKPESL